MFGRFDSDRSRYASLGIVPSLPSDLVDSIWLIVDLNLGGVIPLNDLLHFDLLNSNGKVTVHFSREDSSVEVAIGLPFSHSTTYPSRVFTSDDGHHEAILLPVEVLES